MIRKIKEIIKANPQTRAVLFKVGLIRREEKALASVNKNGRGLEIGPSFNPIAPKSKGFNVHILDHATKDELKEKYQGHNVNLDNIEDVDFVWSGQSYRDLIGQTDYYDWIIASHVIEHVPDLVSFLQECEALLKEGGVLSLIIPDKRYCFDYFSPPSSTGNILDAWVEKRKRPSRGQIFDCIANKISRKGQIAWNCYWGMGGIIGGAFSGANLEAGKKAWFRSESTQDYIDVHCWRFTPASFRLILSDLCELNLINLHIKTTFNTTIASEFYVSLVKTRTEATQQKNRLEMLQQCKKEDI